MIGRAAPSHHSTGERATLVARVPKTGPIPASSSSGPLAPRRLLPACMRSPSSSSLGRPIVRCTRGSAYPELLINDDCIEAIVSLPPSLFYGTGRQ